MSNQIAIRPWVASHESLTALIRLCSEQWGGAEGDLLSSLCTSTYVFHALRHTSTGVVAVDDGQIVGVCLLGLVTNGRLPDDTCWKEREESATVLMESLPWRRERVAMTLKDMREEDAIVASALHSHWHPSAQVPLLVVDQRYRGLGIGSRMLAKIREIAERRQLGSLFLITDTESDWQYYEHLQFLRTEFVPSALGIDYAHMLYFFMPSMLPGSCV